MGDAQAVQQQYAQYAQYMQQYSQQASSTPFQQPGSPAVSQAYPGQDQSPEMRQYEEQMRQYNIQLKQYEDYQKSLQQQPLSHAAPAQSAAQQLQRTPEEIRYEQQMAEYQMQKQEYDKYQQDMVEYEKKKQEWFSQQRGGAFPPTPGAPASAFGYPSNYAQSFGVQGAVPFGGAGFGTPGYAQNIRPATGWRADQRDVRSNPAGILPPGTGLGVPKDNRERCRDFYSSGACGRGARCIFRHESAPSVPSKLPSVAPWTSLRPAFSPLDSRFARGPAVWGDDPRKRLREGGPDEIQQNPRPYNDVRFAGAPPALLPRFAPKESGPGSLTNSATGPSGLIDASTDSTSSTSTTGTTSSTTTSATTISGESTLPSSTTSLTPVLEGEAALPTTESSTTSPTPILESDSTLPITTSTTATQNPVSEGVSLSNVPTESGPVANPVETEGASSSLTGTTDVEPACSPSHNLMTGTSDIAREARSDTLDPVPASSLSPDSANETNKSELAH